ncbi:MAG TPA: imelysin family protein [Kofleriaceae bacterium]|nr:imelysin family protein [Kofleriaceae bacterium]
MKTSFNFTAGPAAAIAACAAVALATGCGGDDGGELSGARPAIDNYIAIARAGYDDTLATAKALKAAVDAFVAAPTPATLEAARTAWKAAREPYGQSEVFRFYDGPIDNLEPLINSWPLDEVYIDYVEGNPTGGIINDPVTFPVITKQLIADRNAAGAEENISAGYHAIEFLLWGQDLDPNGPGARPHTDYLPGKASYDRRGQYLKLVTELLVDDLQSVVDAWRPDAPYPAEFAADPKEAVRRMLQGMGSLGGAELAGERMTVALDNRDQEDEQSCFSDNTHRDLRADALAIQNAYLGRYGEIHGAGLDELVRARDAALDAKLAQQLEASIAAIADIPVPFDRAIADEAGRAKVLAAVRALQTQTETIVEVATLFGIQLNLK